MRLFCFFLAFLLTFPAWVGCDSTPSTDQKNTSNPQQNTVSLPNTLFSKTPTDGAKSVLTVRQEGKVGETVTLTGYIGGRKEPFTPNRATFLLADASLPPCEDACGAPWDACCETPEDIAKSVATIQVSDEKGNPLKCDIKNQGGLKPMSTVIVQGVVVEKDDHVLVVNAHQIYVKP